MRRLARLFLPGLIAMALGISCKCEAKKAMKAVDTFMGFSQGEDMTQQGAEKAPEYHLRRRSEEVVNNRPRITAEVEVNPALDRASLEKVLRNACHDDKLHGGTAVIKVIAWPGKLKRLARPVGQCIFARDGHGWEGTGVGFEKIEVRLPDAGTMKSMGLSPMTEAEYLRILGVENLLQRGIARDEAIHQTAARHGVHVQQVILALEKAEKLWGTPGKN